MIEIQLLNALLAATGITIFSESMILAAGINILRIGDWSWINRKNELYLAADILGGIAMVLLALLNSQNAMYYPILIILIFQLFSHLARSIEHFKRGEKRFLNTVTLVIFNRIKIISLFAILVIYLLIFIE